MTSFMNPLKLRSNRQNIGSIGKPALAPATPRNDTRQADQSRDIYYTAFLLRQKLVVDVVSLVLHHAGLFERHAYGSRAPRPITVREESSPLTCFATPPIRSSARIQRPVQKIAFVISSCDQGWADNMNGGSWTWFTAGVISESRSNADANAENGFNHLQVSDEMPKANSSFAQNVADDPSSNERFLDRERQIFRNPIATLTCRPYIIEWSADSNDDEERRWVSELKNGDIVVVRAWAQLVGWENKIQSVSVVFYTTAVV